MDIAESLSASVFKNAKRINLTANNTVHKIYLPSYATILVICGGGDGFNIIDLLYTGSSGTITITELITAQRIHLSSDTDHELKVTIEAATTRFLYFISLSDTPDPYEIIT